MFHKISLKVIIVFTLSISFFLSCNETEKKQKPLALTISEGFKNPIGFYNPKPTFS